MQQSRKRTSVVPGILIGLVALLLGGTAQAAPGEAARREIAGLIGALDGSSCRFQRNGSWHASSSSSAPPARAA